MGNRVIATSSLRIVLDRRGSRGTMTHNLPFSHALFPDGASGMNDASRHKPKPPPLIERWRSLLLKASRPFRGQDSSDPVPLWAAPGQSPQGVCGVFPHGGPIQAVLFRYATILDIPMSFRVAVSRYSPPAPGGAVHVHAFALPTLPVLLGVWSRVSMVPLPVAHGMPLSESACRALEPGTQFGRGFPLLDGDGYVVGEHLGTNLYCLFDLLGQEESSVPVLLRRHLDLGLPRLTLVLAAERGIPAHEVEDRLRLLRDETESLASTCRRQRRAVAREAYISACRERVADEVRFLEDEIAILEEGVEEMARRITSDMRRLREGRRRLHLSQGWQDPLEDVGLELQRIQEMPEVCGAHREDGWIRLTTASILVEYLGRRHCLGRFQLDLFFNGDVRIVNLTNRVGPFDHPHVRAGRPCLGGVREGVAKLLGELQVAAAAEVLIDFLKTVNPAEWRLPVFHWPETGQGAEHGVLAAT